MSVKIVDFKDLQPQSQLIVAERVSDYTKVKLGEKPQMLPVEPGEVEAKFCGAVALTEVMEKFCGTVVLALEDRVLCGYIGAAPIEVHGTQEMTEVGTLWVPTKYRRQRIAHSLVAAVTKKVLFRGVLPYAFCNKLSLPIFTDSGYLESEPEKIPTGAFSACQRCPAKPENGCCDTIVLYPGEAA